MKFAVLLIEMLLKLTEVSTDDQQLRMKVFLPFRFFLLGTKTGSRGFSSQFLTTECRRFIG